MSTTVENLSISGPAGRLEGLLNIPDGPLHRVALVCHPHPLYGGTMHNNVVYNTARALRERGVAVLRFNFRGVGLSEGTYDAGRGEQRDAQAALEALLARFPDRPCWVGGFSFGSWVGLRVGLDDPRVDGLLGVGMPVNKSDFSWLKESTKPLAVVQGGGDEFGSEAVIRLLVDRLPCPRLLQIVPDAGHFFPARFDALREAVRRGADFLEEQANGT